jgi:hypothetical protein
MTSPDDAAHQGLREIEKIFVVGTKNIVVYDDSIY